MTSYTVHKILTEGSKQLLLIQALDNTMSICVYDEHTGTTLMRMTSPSVKEFEHAIELLKT